MHNLRFYCKCVQNLVLTKGSSSTVDLNIRPKKNLILQVPNLGSVLTKFISETRSYTVCRHILMNISLVEIFLNIVGLVLFLIECKMTVTFIINSANYHFCI